MYDQKVWVENAVHSNRMAYRVSELAELSIPTYDGSGQGVHPSVVYVPDLLGGHRWWMAFTPFRGGNDDYENPSILCSDDGINWRVPNGLTNPVFGPPPLVTSGDWYADTEMAYNWKSHKLMLWFSHFGSVSKTYYTESTNGVTWSPLTECNVALGPCGIRQTAANTFVCWFGSGFGEGALKKQLSIDGINWVQQPEVVNIFGGFHWHISVSDAAAGYCFLSAASGLLSSESPAHQLHDVYFGYSLDGNFIVFDSTPLAGRNDATWCNRRLYRSSMVNLGDGKYRAYVSSEAIDHSMHIGYFDFVTNNPAAMVYQAVKYYQAQKTSYPIATELAIRDTDEIALNTGNVWQHYTNKILCVHNGLNCPIVIRATTNWGMSGNIFFGSARTQQTLTINGIQYANVLFTSADLAILGQRLPGPIILRAKCTTAPTTGTFSATLYCWN